MVTKGTFTDKYLESYRYFKQLWDLQSAVKRRMLCTILANKIEEYVEFSNGKEKTEEVAEDQFGDDISCLKEFEKYLTPEMRAEVDQQRLMGDMESMASPVFNSGDKRPDRLKVIWTSDGGEKEGEVRFDRKWHDLGSIFWPGNEDGWMWWTSERGGEERIISDEPDFQKMLDIVRHARIGQVYIRPYVPSDEQSD
jgi:hypothetical protein